MTQRISHGAFFAAALLLVVGAGAIRAAQAPEPQFIVTGTWVFDVITPAGPSAPIVTFTQDGEKIAGHYSSQMLGEADLTGTLKGDDLTFSFMGSMQGMSVPVRYEARVSADGAMSGAMDIDMVGQGTFTGRLTRVHERATIPATSASDGRQMYQTYCASCHGASGDGDGPVATMLKTAPADLTTLAARNRGTFPALRVRQSIDGAADIAAHGSREMPVWGALFSGLDENPVVKDVRIDRLTSYIESMQK